MRFVMDGIDLASGPASGPASERDSAGRFVPGRSGNPAGKKPGTRNRKTVLAEALRDGEDITVARVVIDKALAGDAVAARFCLGLLSPKPRGRPIVLDLPEEAGAGDILAAFDATLAAMAAGDITPDEALVITRVLDGRRRALEALALQRRLDAEAARAAAEPASAGDAGDAPDARESDACENTGIPLHSPCISPSPAAIRGVIATLPAEERRLVAAMVRQQRAAFAVAAP
jgi:hypothetical protein